MKTSGDGYSISNVKQINPKFVITDEGFSVLPLIQALCDGLSQEGIDYCHWKSNQAIDRSANGDNDLDLLVSRGNFSRFSELLFRLGFKQAKASPLKQMPGVQDYYGYDSQADRLVHVHTHYQLILGHDMTKNYRLPIEAAYIASATQGEVFRIPAPEFEFIVLVIRMILKHATWDVMLGREGSLSKAERRELEYLQGIIDPQKVGDILKAHLPWLNAELFNDCLQALRPGCSAWTRLKAGRRLQAQLQAFARHSTSADTFLKFWRRAVLILRRRISKSSAKHQFETGGAVIAFVGGDGAGKSTAIDGLHAWLSKDFDLVKVHLGKPAWSKTTILLRSVLKIGQLLGLYPLEATFQETLEQKSRISPGYPFLMREVCRARDRFNTYLKARRYAANGGLAIFDRFPLAQIELMDGPQVGRFVRQLQAGPQGKRFLSPHPHHWLVKFLAGIEENYYRKVVSPELMFVLRLDPEMAVQRKPEEMAASVRARSTAIMSVDWENTRAHVIDASRPKQAVMAELKTLIWSEL